MSCKVCFENYDCNSKKPYSIHPCNHTFCIECLNRLESLQCPRCKSSIIDKKPNYDLIDVLEISKLTDNLETLNRENNHQNFLKEKNTVPNNNQQVNVTDNPLVNTLSNYECVSTFGGNTGLVSSLIELSDNRIVSGCGKSKIKIWDLDNGRCISNLEGHTQQVQSLALLSTKKGNYGERIISGSEDFTIKIWNPNTKKCLHTLEGHTGAVLALIVLGNFKIASGSSDKTIKIWASKQAKCLDTFHGHEGSVLALIDYANRIVSGSTDNTIKIWNQNTGECIQTLTGHNGSVLSLNLLLKTQNINRFTSLSNYKILSGSDDKTIRIWDGETFECLKTLDVGTRRLNSFVVLSNDQIATISGSNTIQIWNPNTGQCMGTVKGRCQKIISLTLLYNENDALIVSSMDNRIKIWHKS